MYNVILKDIFKNNCELRQNWKQVHRIPNTNTNTKLVFVAKL